MENIAHLAIAALILLAVLGLGSTLLGRFARGEKLAGPGGCSRVLIAGAIATGFCIIAAIFVGYLGSHPLTFDGRRDDPHGILTASTSDWGSFGDDSGHLTRAYGSLAQQLSLAGKDALAKEQNEWALRRDSIRDPEQRARFIEQRVQELMQRATKKH